MQLKIRKYVIHISSEKCTLTASNKYNFCVKIIMSLAKYIPKIRINNLIISYHEEDTHCANESLLCNDPRTFCERERC